MLLYAITGFLSAFLLFQVQPVIAKLILPWFGGSSSVWTTCMLFFQVALLGGYLYAHWLNRKLAPRTQAWVHCAALAASLLTLPILPDAGWKPMGPEHPSPRILGLLAASVGLPYFLLASTSPLLQAWYARRHQGASPYRLYALSNLGSLLALLSYPVLVEPLFSTRFQGLWWSAAYAAFAALCGWTAWRPFGAAADKAAGAAEFDASPPTWRDRAVWLALAGCASVLLLAVTTFLTQDVASIPFLWILPLGVYLLSFILCFDAPRYYRRWVFLPLLAVSLAGLAFLMKDAVEPKWLMAVVGLVAAALFVCCMVCHGELVRRKPHPLHLTDFYVMVSVGGAAGGLFVGVLAPAAFNAYYELPIGLAACAILAVGILLSDRGGWFRKGWRWVWRIPLAAALLVYLAAVAWVVRGNVTGYRLMERNFYGQLRVQDYQPVRQDPYRILVHGLINHGHQFLAGPYRNQPVSYFCPGTGIGDAMQARREGAPMRVGILGLGIGTLVAYARPGDTFRLYEINPLVRDIAEQEFSYLRDSKAKVEVVLGDGRLSLEREPDQRFDLLVMDAFSGDSVPVHLVTREAFATYFRHLRPGGILAVNTSNRHLDLKPVMERNAAWFGKAALQFEFSVYEDDGDDGGGCLDASWTLIVDPATRETSPRLFTSGRRIPPRPDFRMWTDDFSNLYGILK